MSIRITTSEYNTTKNATIDGVEFKVRPMSSSESLAMIAISNDMKRLKKSDDQESSLENMGDSLNKITEIYFSLFDKPEEAKKMLGGLSIDAWFNIYEKIMKGE